MSATKYGANRGETFAGYSDLEVVVCTCGVLFAAPIHMLNKRREDGKTFYCPNGHSLAYRSENAQLRKRLDGLKDDLARERARRDQTEASLRATKGVVTKQKQKLERVSKGVCPCCNRSFRDLKRHMTTKHPDYKGQPQ